jgi:hypothetical protein
MTQEDSQTETGEAIQAPFDLLEGTSESTRAKTAETFLELLGARVRNPNTRSAYRVEAVSEVLRQRCLFGGLTLALGRVAVSPPEPAGRIEWLGLRGLEALRLSGVERGEGESVSLEAAGKLCFVGPGVGLHPLAIYREDAWGRHQVGF